MNRAESLAVLHQWALSVRADSACFPQSLGHLSPYNFHEARTAQAYGFRAVHEIQETSRFPYAPWIDMKAVIAASLAFRTALNAVGIKGAL